MTEGMRIVNKTADIGEIYIYGFITDPNVWSGGSGGKITWFRDEIARVKDAKTVNVFVNSSGGEVFSGFGIYEQLKRLPGNVVAYVDGIAASIASVVLLGAKRVIAPKNALMMIHKPSGMAIGTSVDMRATADALDRVQSSIAAIYSDKAKRSAEDMSELMDKETWFSGEEAYEAGLIDEIATGQLVNSCLSGGKAIVNGITMDLSGYKSVPTDKFGDNTAARAFDKMRCNELQLNKCRRMCYA